MVSRLRRLAVLAACCAGAVYAQSDLLSVASPNGQIEFRLFLTREPDPSEAHLRLAYQVLYQGKMMLDTSFLGLNIRDQPILGDNVGLSASKRSTVDETYTVPAGKASRIRDHYNAITANYLQNGSLGRLISVEARVYDDGVAFRYLIPWSNQMDDAQIDDEFTEFNFAKDGKSYPQIVPDFNASFEDGYSPMPVSGIHDDWLVAAPLLVEQPGAGWVAVTQAGVDKYAGMYLKHEQGTTMMSTLTPRADDNSTAVHVKAPWTCPWRVLLIGPDPGALVESSIVESLNPPSAIKETSWIKPGKALDAPVNGAISTAAIEREIDFAAASKIEYVLIGKGWAKPGEGGVPDVTKPVAEVDLPRVVSYAKANHAGIWVQCDWTSIQLRMEPAFAWFEKLGIAGVRIDGMHRDDQWMVDYYHQMIKAAADHHLMLDLHDAYVPDGIERTWPNVMTRDAVLGEKHDRSDARANPDFEAMLPFTRMLAGPLDYGLGGFDNVTPADFAAREAMPMTLGTRAHQLALYVVFDSPLQMVSGAAQSYQGQKDFEFIREVPSSWDETRFVGGKVGEFAVIARRKGADWYVGAITNADAREVKIPLAFLGTGSGDYTAEIYADATDAAVNPKHTSVETRRVSSLPALDLSLAPGGGAAVRLTPVK